MLGIVLSLIVALLWSVSPILHKIIYRSGIDPKTMMIVSGGFYMLALTVYTSVHCGSLQRDVAKLTPGVLALIAVSVVFTAFISNLIYYYAIKAYPAFLVTGICYSAPLFTVLFAWLFIREHGLGPLSWAGVILVVAGVICLAATEKSS
jgi:uncharacterized membrane protein